MTWALLGFLLIALAIENPKSLIHTISYLWCGIWLAVIAMFVLWFLSDSVRADELPFQEVKITFADPAPRQPHLVCEVDDVHFMVPRRIVESGEKFVLEHRVTKQIDGTWKTWTVRLGLPWLKHLCREFSTEPSRDRVYRSYGNE